MLTCCTIDPWFPACKAPSLWLAAGVLLLCVSGSAAAPPHADSLDERLLAEMPKVVKYLNEHQYHSVGVLKFSVKKGHQAASYNVGTLNTKMALRLEHALVMANDSRHPITILQDPTAEAAKSRGLTLGTAKGRRALLDHAYPVAWGNKHQKPDALLTGEVALDGNMRQATITIKAFEHRHPERMETVATIKNLKADRELLASAGQSFVVPRRLAGARGLEEGAADDAAADDAANRDKSGSNPLKSADDPIKLEILYDGQPVALVADDSSPGELKARRSKTQADVREGQAVGFKITNTSQSKIGVVLAINGRNTLFQEDLTQRNAGECSKWILDPGETYAVNGFYMSNDGKSVFPFRVLSDEESAKVEMAPEHKGVYSLYVFSEGTGSAETAQNIELARKIRAKSNSASEAKENLKRGLHVKEVNGRLVRDSSATSARPATRHAKNPSGRGLVVAGNEAGTGSQLKELQVKFNPEPIMTVFVRYYADAPAGASKEVAAE